MTLPEWNEGASDRALAEALARETLFAGDPAQVAEAVAWFDRYPAASDRAFLARAYGQRRRELQGVPTATGADLACELGRVAAERWAGVHTGLRILLRQELLGPCGASFLPVMEAVDGDWVRANRDAIEAALSVDRRPASPAPDAG